MKVSLSWLNDYVSMDMEIGRLIDLLTMVGLEVEAVEDRFEHLKSVVTGRVETVTAHPNADKLKIGGVTIGDRTLRIVCGAPNLKAGQIVPVALPGTRFPEGTILKESVIRGERSQGMICSEGELGLGTATAGIMVLDNETPPGLSLNQALHLSDTVLELGITPNRPDCLSLIGVAREIAGIFNSPLRYPDTSINDSQPRIDGFTSVKIEAPELCPRYAARLLFGIKVGPSPHWLKDRLLSVGLRPINNIVDITNFVMLETGQPLHAFDFDRLARHCIVVRKAMDGEPFFTLDQKQRRLSADMLMICDGEKPVAVGGVMGGMNSEIEADTTRVLLESAYFNPVSIRKTSKRLGLSTDASYRFERGVDPDGTITAINRAAKLMAEITGADIVPGLIDEHPQPASSSRITLSVSDTNRLLGTDLKRDTVQALLQAIEFAVEPKNDNHLVVTPPSFRVDVSRPEDLMEEVARHWGYNKIPSTYPAIPARGRAVNSRLILRRILKQFMVGFGFSEVINYSFIAANSSDRLRLHRDDPRRNTVVILNPLTEEQAEMRISLVPGLLETVHRNLSKQEKNLRLFEIGKIYTGRGREELPLESEILAGLLTGSLREDSWLGGERVCDFYDLKGVVEALLDRLGVNGIEFKKLERNDCSYSRPGYSALILADARPLGRIGEIAPPVLNDFDLKQTAYIFELDVDELLPMIPTAKVSRALPKFPSVSRDATLIVDKSVEAGRILKGVEELNEELIEAVQLFDVFEGRPIPSGKKSISFRIVYRSAQRTLEDEEVNRLHKSITSTLLDQFKATLPPT